MKTLVFLLEESSAEEMLKGILPKIFPEHEEKYHIITIPFEGKQDLEKQLERKIKYWQLPDTSFLILRDQDRGDCKLIKKKLLSLVSQTGKKSVIRIACHELESFYLGDLLAVEKALELPGLSKNQNKEKYRSPDNLDKPSWELIQLTNGLYQKMAGSRAIAPLLDLENNRSRSFKVLIEGVRRMAEEP